MDEQPFRDALDFLVKGPHARAMRWAAARNVVGFGYGPRRVGGSHIRELALKVYVKSKLPRSRVRIPIPRELEIPGHRPVPIDVVAMGNPSPHGSVVPAGSAIGHDGGGWGTLGCLVTKTGDTAPYILGNSHVLALCGYAHEGEAIRRASSTAFEDRIATLDKWVPFVGSDGFDNVVDAAIAKVDDTDLVSAAILDLGVPTGVSWFAPPGSKVRVHGAASGTRTAEVTDANFHGKLDYDGPAGSFTLGFRDQILIEPINEPGDSGAIALNESGRIVGMHCWGSRDFSVYNKIRNVTEQLGVQPVVTDPVPAALDTAMPDQGHGAAALDAVPVRARATAIDILARTLYGEARGEPREGREGVACVVLNRARRRTVRWGDTVEAVCLMRLQFSCWNANDPNRAKLQAVTDSDRDFVACTTIATQAVDGELPDSTDGSTHYCAQGANPNWAVGKQPAREYGHHLFYNNVA